MEKKNFLNIFDGEDKILLAMLYEDIELCRKINYPVYTEVFLSPQIWSKLIQMKISLGVDIYTQGLNSSSEKRVCMFVPAGEEIYSYDYPTTYFRISGGNKFRELEHRHFLAAIMSLGIKREKLGDLIVRDGVCYGIILSDLFSYLETNLISIGGVDLATSAADTSLIPMNEFEERIVSVSSLRLDSIVAAITGGSRSSSVEYIDGGQVGLNYNIKRKKDLFIATGDIISIRKFGKYVFSEVLGESKKGKIRILLKKYV